MIFLFLLLSTIPVTSNEDMSHRYIADGFAKTYCFKMNSMFGYPCEVLEKYYDANGNNRNDSAAYVLLVSGDRQILTYKYASKQWTLDVVHVRKDHYPKQASRVDAAIED